MGSKGSRHGKVTVGGKSAAINNGSARPPRVAQIAAAVQDTPRNSPRRKNTRRWCKGKVGVEHVPAIVFRPWYGRTCQAAQGWQLSLFKSEWMCEHREICQNCDKILREPWKLRKQDCPVWWEAQGLMRPGDPCNCGKLLVPCPRCGEGSCPDCDGLYGACKFQPAGERS
jgi:hypothetical protein